MGVPQTGKALRLAGKAELLRSHTGPAPAAVVRRGAGLAREVPTATRSRCRTGATRAVAPRAIIDAAVAHPQLDHARPARAVVVGRTRLPVVRAGRAQELRRHGGGTQDAAQHEQPHGRPSPSDRSTSCHHQFTLQTPAFFRLFRWLSQYEKRPHDRGGTDVDFRRAVRHSSGTWDDARPVSVGPRPTPGSGGMSEYGAWFECINGCPTRFSLFEVIYRCPTCGDLLDVAHDVDALRRRVARGVDAAVRRPLPPQRLSVRLRGVGQEGMGRPVHRQREHRLDVRGRHQPLVGRPLRQAARRRGSVGQAVRQLAHRARSRTSA